MHTDLPAHPQAYLMMHTGGGGGEKGGGGGTGQFVRPSLRRWTLYGLGTENENLPGFIAIKPIARNGGPQNFGSAALARRSTRERASAKRLRRSRTIRARQYQEPPARHSRPAHAARPCSGDESRAAQAQKVQPGVEGVIESYELAFRMQSAYAGRDGPLKGVECHPGPVRHR